MDTLIEVITKTLSQTKCEFHIYPFQRYYYVELKVGGTFVGKSLYNIGKLPLSKLKEKIDSYTDYQTMKKEFSA